MSTDHPVSAIASRGPGRAHYPNPNSRLFSTKVGPQTPRPRAEKLDLDWTVARIEIPGLLQLQSPKYSTVGKIFWFLLIVTSSGLCTQQVYQRCHRYIFNPIDVRVRLERCDYIDLFPELTFCTTNSSIFSDQAVNFSPFWNATIGDLMNEEKFDGDALEVWRSLRIDKRSVNLTEASAKETYFRMKYVPTYRGDCLSVYAPTKIFHIGAKTGVVVQITPQNTDKTVEKEALRFTYKNTKEDPCGSVKEVSDCWRKCHERLIRLESLNSNIDCRIPSMEDYENKPCTKAEEVNVIYKAVEKVFRENKDEECKCPRRCEEFTFNLIPDVVKDDDDGKTTIYIYIPDDSINSLTEFYQYNFVDLLCDLGGTLGLFLGFCALTLVELVEIAIDYVRYKFRNLAMCAFGKLLKT